MSRQDVFRLSAETGIHPATIDRWLNGTSTSAATGYAIEAACRKLGIELRSPDGGDTRKAG